MKILMVTMSLDIGGAETHIAELSKELKKRGFDIVIVSNGGVYVDEIEKHGIRHVQAPLHSRSTACMYKSYRILKKLVKREDFDVVHAHARIPAFIMGLVRKSVPFNFVTTAHGVYDTSGVLKYLTNWGDKTIAVSQDIVSYLTDSYGVPRQDISITINGIDTERFSPQISAENIINEFSLDNAEPVICHVSRLDEDSSTAAEQLIEAMPLVAEKVDGAQLLIAGSGTEFARFSARAEEINKKIGRKAVIMAGPRVDINEIVAACDVFVGVSRTALEAMAAEKPVILAGNAGYMGLFAEEKLKEARDTNFCCRGSMASRVEMLADDIADCIARIGSEELAEICRFGRRVVIDEYSVERMADDCVKVYNIVIKKKYRILMSGYYGFSNAGDEAILNSIYNNLVALDENIDISVLVAYPERSVDIYDFRMVDRFNFWKVFKSVRRCDLLISGGGSLLQDRTSTKSIVYYLTIINLAKFLGKKVMMYANGIGPVLKPINRKRVRRAVNRIDLVTLRDENSVNELRSMGVNRDDLNVTADPVFTFDCIDKKEAERLAADAGIPADRPFVGVSIRDWYNVPDFRKTMAEICDDIYDKYNLNIVFIVMQTPNDIEISRDVQKRMKNPSYILSGKYKTAELMGIVGCAHFIMCMRLHTLIFAAHMDVPTLGIVYDPKVRDYLKMLDMPSMGDVDALDRGFALKQAEHLIQNRDDYVTALQKKTINLKARARKNEELLLRFMKENL